MKFELNESQLNKLKNWQAKIKKKFGHYGHFDYTFTPFGMGTGVKVTSHLSKEELDLSEVENW